MRKVKLAMYVALDGVVENPAWTAPYWNDEISAMQEEYLYSSDELLLGRVTYEGFAASWPTMEEETGDFGRKMNSMPKRVASRTLSDAEWNAAIIDGDLGEAVRAMKQEDGADILIYGSGELVDELTRLSLIDEYRLIVYPVLVGEGKRLFASQPERALSLKETASTASGIVVLTYDAA
ncbi:MAG TPA: dihydrofolate reductase family protein [Solirubrobacteraceae bacterium]|nr:dihydrofolate reductase family protein [Solirubrobacteraceae bacterium]